MNVTNFSCTALALALGLCPTVLRISAPPAHTIVTALEEQATTCPSVAWVTSIAWQAIAIMPVYLWRALAVFQQLEPLSQLGLSAVAVFATLFIYFVVVEALSNLVRCFVRVTQMVKTGIVVVGSAACNKILYPLALLPHHITLTYQYVKRMVSQLGDKFRSPAVVAEELPKGKPEHSLLDCTTLTWKRVFTKGMEAFASTKVRLPHHLKGQFVKIIVPSIPDAPKAIEPAVPTKGVQLERTTSQGRFEIKDSMKVPKFLCYFYDDDADTVLGNGGRVCLPQHEVVKDAIITCDHVLREVYRALVAGHKVYLRRLGGDCKGLRLTLEPIEKHQSLVISKETCRRTVNGGVDAVKIAFDNRLATSIGLTSASLARTAATNPYWWYTTSSLNLGWVSQSDGVCATKAPHIVRHDGSTEAGASGCLGLVKSGTKYDIAYLHYGGHAKFSENYAINLVEMWNTIALPQSEEPKDSESKEPIKEAGDWYGRRTGPHSYVDPDFDPGDDLENIVDIFGAQEGGVSMAMDKNGRVGWLNKAWINPSGDLVTEWYDDNYDKRANKVQAILDFEDFHERYFPGNEAEMRVFLKANRYQQGVSLETIRIKLESGRKSVAKTELELELEKERDQLAEKVASLRKEVTEHNAQLTAMKSDYKILLDTHADSLRMEKEAAAIRRDQLDWFQKMRAEQLEASKQSQLALKEITAVYQGLLDMQRQEREKRLQAQVDAIKLAAEAVPLQEPCPEPAPAPKPEAPVPVSQAPCPVPAPAPKSEPLVSAPCLEPAPAPKPEQVIPAPQAPSQDQALPDDRLQSLVAQMLLLSKPIKANEPGSTILENGAPTVQAQIKAVADEFSKKLEAQRQYFVKKLDAKATPASLKGAASAQNFRSNARKAPSCVALPSTGSKSSSRHVTDFTI